MAIITAKPTWGLTKSRPHTTAQSDCAVMQSDHADYAR